MMPEDGGNMKKAIHRKRQVRVEEIIKELEMLYRGRRSKNIKIIAYNLLHSLLEVKMAGEAFVNAPRAGTVRVLQAKLDHASIYLGVLKELPESLLKTPVMKQ
jgi:hypothetical protein